MNTAPILILASASPRRRELLTQLGIHYDTVVVQADENPRSGEAAQDYVCRVAAEKSQLGLRQTGARLPVLGADTEVVLDGQVFGKPTDADHARLMLGRLSGREHQVISAVSLRDGEAHWRALSISTVRFRVIDADEIDAYWASGEPRDKAGAYAIQGRGAVFVEHLAGSYSGVMGLPVFETAALLKRIGISIFQTESA